MEKLRKIPNIGDTKIKFFFSDHILIDLASVATSIIKIILKLFRDYNENTPQKCLMLENFRKLMKIHENNGSSQRHFTIINNIIAQINVILCNFAHCFVTRDFQFICKGVFSNLPFD